MARLLAVLSIAIASIAFAADWPTDYDAALQQAKDTKRPLLVHFRSSCGICNKPTDKALRDAEKHEPIVKLYESFVRVRVNDGAVVGEVGKLIEQNPPSASLLIVDPNGRLIFAVKSIEPNAYLGLLKQASDDGPTIVQAAALRASGRAGDADHLLGGLYLRFGQASLARDAFELARRELEKAGQGEQAELAGIHADFARGLMRGIEKDNGMSALMRATMFAKSKMNVAEAWMGIGTISKVGLDRHTAVKAYRKARELAPAGSAIAAQARRELELLDDHSDDKPTAGAASVRVIGPNRASITGRAEFAAEVDRSVSKVEFLLDDAPAATVTTSPFRTRLDLGSVPRARTIKVIAYDSAGAAIGEAVTTINDRADAPRVTLVSPVTDVVRGVVSVEADAKVPQERAVKSVELFWNEARLAHFDRPPYRVDFEVPKGFGYFRAVATLDDGSTAEDTRVVNASGMSAMVDVHAVAFVATVTDREGKRIGGLAPNDFVIRDEGQPVDATIKEAVDDPVTIGLVIDASGSMRTGFLYVTEAASMFLDTAVTEKDRVFVVAFDAEPRLLHGPSDEAAKLKSVLLKIRPSGGTAVVDGVAFGLQQFAGIPGKKALVVLTDGFEGASSQTSAAAIHLAKDSGIPVYGIVTGGGRLGNPLDNIAAATGGSMFFSPKREELLPMFRKIRDEVRGQYLISFVAGDRGKAGQWRKLTVEVPGREARVRTVSGYFAR
jgi:Ca-activated chloride channel family protein